MKELEQNIPTPLTDEAFQLFVKSGHTNHDLLLRLLQDLERKLTQKTEELKVLKFCKDGSDKCVDRLRTQNDQQFNRIKALELEIQKTKH